jgi:hypothetical protein
MGQRTEWRKRETIQIELEYCGGDIYDVDGNSIPPDVIDIITELIGTDHKGLYPADIIINFTSEGYYDPGSTYNPETAYPPEGCDERTLDSVEFIWDESTHYLLTPEQQTTIFNAFEETVNTWEIE